MASRCLQPSHKTNRKEGNAMLYKIIPASPVASIIDAESPESAIVDFACVMDLDMNTYFKAVPATEEDVKEANA